jgi:glycosyl-4,4'-diaponeurosporenoate acyltransferase
MIVELPLAWTVTLNVGLWPAFHLLLPFLLVRRAAARFDPQGWLYRPRRWELGGRLYERLFAVHRWKRRLPDGAAWFKSGFSKKRFASREPGYLRRFVRETCRSELVHWLVFACSGVFFLFNEPWVGWLMVAYGALANLPLIVVQRYNRLRLLQELAAKSPWPPPAPASAGSPAGSPGSRAWRSSSRTAPLPGRR